MHEFETDTPFCGNPDCPLHVQAGAPGVIGRGNWARRADGVVTGRARYCGIFLCDDCLRDWQATEVFLPDGAAVQLRAAQTTEPRPPAEACRGKC